MVLFVGYYCLAWWRYNALFAYFSFFLSGVIAISTAEKGMKDIESESDLWLAMSVIVMTLSIMSYCQR